MGLIEEINNIPPDVLVPGLLALLGIAFLVSCFVYYAWTSCDRKKDKHIDGYSPIKGKKKEEKK